MELKRCQWVTTDPIYIKYHDQEWGRPIHDDYRLFEMLSLEGAQAGLSWLTILKKREGYRNAFDQFDFYKISQYDNNKIEELINNPNIVRNKLKINSIINNARLFIDIINQYGSFDQYLWSYVDYKPINNQFNKITDLPSSTSLSDQISKDLKKRGFKFVGSTIIYSFLQAIGIVNDHTTDCYLYQEISQLK